MKTKREEREEKLVSARKRANEHENLYQGTTIKIPQGVNQFKVQKAGPMRVDIMPYRVGKGNPFADEGYTYFERTFWTHRNVGSNNESYICLNKTFKKPCPICDYQNKMRKDPSATDDAIKALNPSERQLWNVIDHSDKKKGIQVWEVAYFNFGKQLDAKLKNSDEEDNYDYFYDLKKGFTLKLGVTEESFAGNSFYKVTDIEFKPRAEPYGKEMIDQSTCLDDLLKETDYNKLKEIFESGATIEDDEEKEPEEKPAETPAKRGRGRPPKATQKPAETEENEDSDIDSDVDEGDDELPFKFKQGNKVKHGKFGVCEVLHVSSEGTLLRLEDSEGNVHGKVLSSECSLIGKDDEDEEEDEDSDVDSDVDDEKEIEEEDDSDLDEEDEDDSDEE